MMEYRLITKEKLSMYLNDDFVNIVWGSLMKSNYEPRAVCGYCRRDLLVYSIESDRGIVGYKHCECGGANGQQ